MSADEPAGNSTVISIVGLCANGFGGAFSAAALATSAKSPNSSPTMCFMAYPCRSIVPKDLLDGDAAALACGNDAGAHHR